MSRHGSAPARPALSGGVSLVVREETTEEHSFGGFERPRGCEQRTDEGTQKPFEPAQEQTEVVAGGGEHGIDTVAAAAFEIIAAHPVLGLDMPNDRLDSGAATHLAADRGGDAAHLAADPDAEFLGVVVAAIAFVDVDATGLDPGQRFQFRDDRPQSVAVEGIAVQCLGVQYKLTAF